MSALNILIFFLIIKKKRLVFTSDLAFANCRSILSGRSRTDLYSSKEPRNLSRARRFRLCSWLIRHSVTRGSWSALCEGTIRANAIYLSLFDLFCMTVPFLNIRTSGFCIKLNLFCIRIHLMCSIVHLNVMNQAITEQQTKKDINRWFTRMPANWRDNSNILFLFSHFWSLQLQVQNKRIAK